MIEDMKAAVMDEITDLDNETIQTETLENAINNGLHTLIYFLKPNQTPMMSYRVMSTMSKYKS